MKLYLSSYHVGKEPEKLTSLVGENKKAAIISNSLDFSTDVERLASSLTQEIADLKNLGFDAEELDLRKYFGKQKELEEKIKDYGLIWVRGGNTFILRRAMQESGFDEILMANTGKDNFVYAGYSAGVCILAPSLKGLELVDDPVTVPQGYKDQTIWEGVGLIDFCIAPHYHSDHPESEAVNKTVDYYIENKMKFIALHDGDAIVENV